MTTNEHADQEKVDRVLSALRTRVAASTAAPPATEIIARGRRRRTAHVTLAGIVVAAVLAASFALTGTSTVQPQPADPPTPTPTQSSPPDRPTPTGSRTDTSGKFPAGFLLHETDGGWRVDGGSVPAQCFGTPRMNGGVGRFVGENADQVMIGQDVYVYADEAAARQVFAGLRKELRACSGFPDAKILKKAESLRIGDEAAAITLALPADGANEHTGAPVHIVVLRVGTAVVYASGFPQIPEIEDDARAVAKRLCLYDPDCKPRAGLPAALPALRGGGEAWVAVLDTFDANDGMAKPGVAMAAAAEQGYHAAVVPVECDEGAGPALGLSGAGARYVAVYFGGRADAEAFAAALPAFGVRILGVRTHCV